MKKHMVFREKQIIDLVRCIFLGIGDDIKQAIMSSDLDRSTMNSYAILIWDIIYHNVQKCFENDPDIIVGYTRRTPWNLIVVYDKQTRNIITLMREERLKQIRKDKKGWKHYLTQLVTELNKHLENQQQTFEDYDESYGKQSVQRICGDLSITPEMVDGHSLVLFSSHEYFLNSVRCVRLNRLLEVCEEESWNEYIGAEESVIVDQVDDVTDKHNNPTDGLSLKTKALERKKQHQNIDVKRDSESKEA